jgi:hypothetical protein
MERRMLLNIAALAEGRVPSKAAENAAVALWTITVGLIIAALIETGRRETWWRPLAVAGAACLVFQVLTLLQPPNVMGVALVVALGCGLWWPDGAEAARMRRARNGRAREAFA